MKILAVGDLHIRKSNIKLIRVLRDKLLNIIYQNQIEMVVFLGDLLDNFATTDQHSWNELVKLISEISVRYGTKTKIVIIPGNHDMINNKEFCPQELFLTVLGSNPNVIIASKPTHICVTPNILAVPYVPVGRFKEALKDISDIPWKLIFAHQEFHGCKMGPIESTNGDEWGEKLPLVISGHIHEPQKVGKNIIYLGSPFCQNFGENGKRYVAVLDVTESSVNMNFIDTEMPQKVTLTMAADQFLEWSPAEDDQNEYRIRLCDTRVNIVKVQKHQKIKDLSKSVKLIFKTTDDAVTEKKNRANSSYVEIVRGAITDPEIMSLFENTLKGGLL